MGLTRFIFLETMEMLLGERVSRESAREVTGLAPPTSEQDMHMTEPAFKILRFNPGDVTGRVFGTGFTRTVAHEYVGILDQHFDGTGTVFFAVREDGEPDLQEWEREDA
jgi:hypothetical protein